MRNHSSRNVPILSACVALCAWSGSAMGDCTGAPGEVGNLELSRTGTSAVIRWSLPEGAQASELVKGSMNIGYLNALGVGETCLGQNLETTEIADELNPASGACFWYLVRATNECGKGPWGSFSLNGTASARVTECGCTRDFFASPRFVDSGATVTDRRTCLEWEKKVSVSSLHLPQNEYSYFDVVLGPPAFFGWLDQVNAERFAGHGDWRLPTSSGPPQYPTGDPAELESILLLSCPGYPTPCIDPIFGPFPADPAPFYWSSTDNQEFPSYRWTVNFINGAWEYHVRRYDPDHVRVVRGNP